MTFENSIGKVVIVGNKIYVSTIYFRNTFEVYDKDEMLLSMLYYKSVYELQDIEKIQQMNA